MYVIMKLSLLYTIFTQKGFDMNAMDGQEFDKLLQSAPGGIAKLAFDDMLTILYATDTFFTLIKSGTNKSVINLPTPLLRMIYSADIIYITQQIAVQKARKDNMIDINFRTLQPDGSFRWVMITGNKTQETHQSGAKTVPVYSCVAMDITSLMVKYKKLEQSSDYNRAIAELSKDLFFEYEIATDTLSFTEIFREIFGKDPILTGFRNRLEKTKMVHAEELPAVVSIFNSMMSGRKQVRFEVRLIPKDGVAKWYLCYASIIFDEYRNPYKVVGKLSPTNPAVREKAKEKKTYKPHLDSLTNVCNKESAEVMINEAASHQDVESLSAFFLVEVKNYKGINELRNVIGGQNVLVDIANILKNHIRTSDIVGRISMGEFVVYMKNIPSDKTVFTEAEHLCKKFDEAFSYNYTKNSVSVSIGITLHRGEQQFQTLLNNANAALVMAKKVPTSSFEVFAGSI